MNQRRPRRVCGTAVKGSILKYCVKYSLDTVGWLSVPGIFSVRTKHTDAPPLIGEDDGPFRGMFERRVQARYIRLEPVEWEGSLTLKADVVVCTVQLTLQLTSTLLSSIVPTLNDLILELKTAAKSGLREKIRNFVSSRFLSKLKIFELLNQCPPIMMHC